MEFDPYSDVFFDDPYETYRRMRDEAPVYHSERWDFYALSRYEDVVAAHRNWETFSSAYGITLDVLMVRQKLNSNMMIITDPPEHDRLRKLVRQVFTRRAIADLEPLVAGVIADVVAVLDGRDRLDLVAEFGALLPVEVICSMLGVPAGERQQIRLWTDEALHRERNNPNITEAGLAASIDMFQYSLDLTRQKRREPDDLIISRLVQATYEEDGVTHRLTDEDITSFIVLLASAGSETVTKLIGNGVIAFADHPGQWDMVRADPARIPGAVEEILRLLTGRTSSTSAGRAPPRSRSATARTAASAPGSPAWRAAWPSSTSGSTGPASRSTAPDCAVWPWRTWPATPTSRCGSADRHGPAGPRGGLAQRAACALSSPWCGRENSTAARRIVMAGQALSSRGKAPTRATM